MSVFLFFVILVSLIVVHELGHFLAAKIFGIRVDEFGIGFPPRLFGRTWGETAYTINLLPFGGFVKIFGEDGQTPGETEEMANRSFMRKPRYIQAAVLVAGVGMNIIAAWLILSVGYMIGLPSDETSARVPLTEMHATIVDIAPNSPAHAQGILPGDQVKSISTVSGARVEGSEGADAVRTFIGVHGEENLSLVLENAGVERTVQAQPSVDVVGADAGKRALGIALVNVGIEKLPVHVALFAGAVLTKDLTIATAVGLWDFAKGIFEGKADFSAVSGPVGIVGVVGEASHIGIAAVLMLAAVISINLAIINLLPFPSLDGGRLFIVGIEALRRKAIPQNLALALNAGGFAVLILLMLIVTYHDIAKLFI